MDGPQKAEPSHTNSMSVVFLRTKINFVFPGEAGSPSCRNHVTYYIGGIWAERAPVLMGSSAPFRERKGDFEKRQKKKIYGQHHLLLEPGTSKGSQKISRGSVPSKCNSGCDLQK